MSRIHTITETQTEELTMPASKFYEIMANHQEKLDMLENETIILHGDVKAGAEAEQAYKDALAKVQAENAKLKAYIDSKSKSFSKEDMRHIRDLMEEKSEYYQKNKKQLIEEAYNRKHAHRIQALREELSRTIMPHYVAQHK